MKMIPENLNFKIMAPPPPESDGSAKNKRNSVLDLLRVIAMLFIVMHHLTINNIGLSEIKESIDRALLWQYFGTGFVDCFVIIGVNLFFLLSGYFGLRLKGGKIFPLIFKVYIYWIVFALIGFAAGLITFDSVLDGVLYMLSAIGKYWFVLAYIAVFLLSPFLNLLAEKLKPQWVKYFVFISMLLFCVIGFAADYVYPILGTNSGYSPIWAAVVYVYGRLLKLYGDKLRGNRLFWGLLFAFLSLINFAAVEVLIFVFNNGAIAWHLFSYNNPLIFIASIAFFALFLKSKPIQNEKAAKIISFIASHTFAVYLLHSNNPLLPRWRAFLLNLFGQELLYAKFLVLLPNAIIIMCVGVAIDALYDLALKKPLDKLGRLIERGIIFLYNKLQILIAKIFKQKD